MSEVNHDKKSNAGGPRRTVKAGKAKDGGMGKSIPSFADLGINDPEATAGLVQCEEQLKEGDRKDVEGTFLRGAAIARARLLCGSKKAVEAWTVKRCNLSRKGAENYERVHLHLSAYRERLVAIGMLRSSMYERCPCESCSAKKVCLVRSRPHPGHSTWFARGPKPAIRKASGFRFGQEQVADQQVWVRRLASGAAIANPSAPST